MHAQPILTVFFFKTRSGDEPVRDWLKELTAKDKKIIGEDIKTVQFGWPLGMPLVRKIEPNLWEIRSTITRGIARILFTQIDGRIVLLHGFIKKTDKTPLDDLSLARARCKEIHEARMK